MKNLSLLFGVGVAGVGFCLVMTIVTGVSEYRERSKPVPLSIPLPAIAPSH